MTERKLTIATRLLEETKQVLLAQGHPARAKRLLPPPQVEFTELKPGDYECVLCDARLTKAVFVGWQINGLARGYICPNCPECRKRILEQQDAQQRALEKEVIL